MNAEKINYVYVGTVMFLLGCYSTLEWWNVRDYRFLLLGLSLLALLTLKLRAFRKYWKQGLCVAFLLLGMWAGSNAHPNPSEQLQPYFGKEMLAYGSIVPESVKRYPYGTSFILRCEQLENTAYQQNLRVFTKE
ncbi:MAG: DUF4131 domain-containing protein, partial [Phascolarctobacterium sp.]|nr:DUF4131 domain-containing protein [Phascolarctobacterium sp.]